MRSELDLEFSSFQPHLQDLADYIQPWRLQLYVDDAANRGDKKYDKIIDSTGSMAARTLRAGMMAGVTSPARRWYRLTTPDPNLEDISSVKAWLHLVSERMATVFLKSNLYNVLPIVYGDIGTFGTSALLVEEDAKTVVRFYSMPVGSYRIANDRRNNVSTFFRETRMTVRQLVERFAEMDEDGEVTDWSNISLQVKTLYDQGQYQTWVNVCHVIEPNPNYNPRRLQSRYKRYLSVYYEKGVASGRTGNYLSNADDDLILGESGYDFFPVLCPRWETAGQDVYATECPGMLSLGDIKQLQVGELRAAQAIEKMVNPPMTGPISAKTNGASILPGHVTWADTASGDKGFRPAHEVDPKIRELEIKQEQVRARIKKAFFEDLFLMLSQSDRDLTATEVRERHEEKLLALGPVLEQINQDLLDPLIDITYYYMEEQGLIPEAPEELQGVELKVEYISIMAQAQKLVGIAGLDRFVGSVAQIAKVDESAMHKINTHQLIDVYGDMLSVPPGIIRTEEETNAIMAQIAKANQAQALAQVIEQGAGAAKNLSQADMSSDNALTRLLNGGGGGISLGEAA